MINIHNILRLLLLVGMVIVPLLQTSAETGSNKPSQPVWEAMDSAANQQGQRQGTPTSTSEQGFAKPPPATNKLSALIITDNATVTKGETITFTLESNQSNLRYYWASNNQKSARSSFIVNTGSLSPGKHRVRASVTNKQRVQAHATLFFNVIDSNEDNAKDTDSSTGNTGEVSNESSNNESTNNDGKIIELPAANVDQPSVNTETTSDTGKIIELPVANPEDSTKDSIENSTTDNANTQDIKNDNSASNETEDGQSSLLITPQRQSVVRGSTAVFTSNVSASDGYQFKWKFTDKRSDSEQFEISSGNLEAGSYLVHLTTKDKNNNETKAQATLVISLADNKLITVPDVVGTKLAEIKTQLEQANLQLGDVSERPVKEGEGIVIEQNPLAGSQLEKGASVNIVVGKAEVPTKPLTVNIQPASMIVEQGKKVEFTAIFVDPGIDTNALGLSWTSANFTSENTTFTIDTSSLPLGKYSVELEVKNTQGQQVSSAANYTATYEVTPKTIKAPDLLGKDIDSVRELLEQSGLKLGDIKQRESSDVSEGQVLEQSPLAGDRITTGRSISITIAAAKKEETTIALSADTVAIKLGDTVAFTTKLVPEPSVEESTDIHYVYTMNAEKKANVKPGFQWIPENEGIYSVSVTAYNDTGMLAKSAPLSIDVSPAWELPVAKILPEMQIINQGANAEFVSTATYDLNSSLNYEWSSDTKHGGSKKQFMFDTTGIEPGTYTVTLNVKDDKNKESSATAMLVVQASVSDLNVANIGANTGGHTSKEDGTNHSQLVDGSIVRPETDPKIHLSVSRQFVSTGSDIKIKVLSDEELIPDSYYFESGDDQNMTWIKANEITHTYKGFGTYTVRAAVKQGEKVYHSKSMTLWVWSPMLLLLTAGIGFLAYALMWWWTKFIPKSKNEATTLPITKPVVIEEQVPLSANASDEDDIVTEARHAHNKTVTSVLKKAIFQFVLGVGISILVLYVILKSANLI